jgi:hypothetical protein
MICPHHQVVIAARRHTRWGIPAFRRTAVSYPAALETLVGVGGRNARASYGFTLHDCP